MFIISRGGRSAFLFLFPSFASGFARAQFQEKERQSLPSTANFWPSFPSKNSSAFVPRAVSVDLFLFLPRFIPRALLSLPPWLVSMCLCVQVKHLSLSILCKVWWWWHLRSKTGRDECNTGGQWYSITAPSRPGHRIVLR